MKARKLVALLMAILMLASMTAFADGEYRASVKDLISLMNFESGTVDPLWKYLGESNAVTAGYWSTAADNDGNKYLNLNIADVVANGDYRAYTALSENVSSGENLSVEFKFRYPTNTSVNTANTSDVGILVGDTVTSRSRARFMTYDYSANAIKIGTDGGTKISDISKDKWYDIRFDYKFVGGTDGGEYRVYVTDPETGVQRSANASGLGKSYAWIGLISFTSNVNAEFHIDDFKAYKFSGEDINAGRVFITEPMNYTANTAGSYTPTDSTAKNQFAINVSNSSETRYMDFVKDEGSDDTFMRVASHKVTGGFIEFRKGVSTYRFLSSDTKGPQALIYGIDIRIADPTQTDTIALNVRDKANNGGHSFFNFVPVTKTVNIGSKEFGGLDLLANTWYRINVYHNNVTGFVKAEFINKATGDVMAFADTTDFVDDKYGYISQYGYYSNCSSGDIQIDYDNLSVTGLDADVDTASKFMDITSENITLSSNEKPAAEGEISASVDVTSYYDKGAKMTNAVANLIMACYDGNGELVGLDVEPVKAQTKIFTATVKAPKNGAENCTYKAMLWDSLYNPLKVSVPVE